MKRTVLLACGLLIALFQTNLSAQTNTNSESRKDSEHFNDTLMLLLPDGNKMLITGQSMKTLLTYNRADSIKQLFAADYEKAIASNTLSADAPLIHYFVHPSGKRRLKAEVGEYADGKIDVNYEITRLNLDLPKFRYCLHDLQTGIEIELYIQNPAQITNLLSNINLSDAIKAAGKEKRSFRKYAKTEITPDNGLFKIDDIRGEVHQAIEINPVVGVTLIGNVFAPLLGVDFTFRSTDKYGLSSYKFGYGLSAFPMVSMAGGEIAKVSFVRSHELKFAKNLNAGRSKKEFWLGVQAGIMSSEDLLTFKNAYKFGVTFKQAGPYSYSFDYIRDHYKNAVYGFTVKLDF